MSIDPAVFRALVASGATPEMLLAAVEAAALSDQARKEQKRVGNAERQRRYRERHSGDSNDSNALHDVTERDSVTSPSLDKEKGTQKEINPTPAHTHARKAHAWTCPEGVDPDHWSDFLANRKRKRLTNTETARKGVMNSLESKCNSEWTPARLVQVAAERGWGSIVCPDDDMFASARKAERQTPSQPADTIAYLSSKYRPAA